MKKLAPAFLFTVILFCTTNTYAKIWRVNNTAGVNANYTSAQTALNAATTLAGDTLHIEPSASSYGTLTVNKPIVIIGNGYFLTEDTGLQVNSTEVSQFSYISFEPGSSGSCIQGISTGNFYLSTSNILMRRNYISSYVYMYAGADNITLLDNFMVGISEQSSPFTGLNLSNNILSGCIISLSSAVSNVTFENNTCINGYVQLYNAQINNNIFYNTSFTPYNSVYFNNIGSSTQFGTANGNQQNVTMVNNVFVASGTTDSQYMLKAGSPAIGAGFGGVDCGAFGGPNPYRLAGIPNVPTIYKLTVPPTGTTNINVTISTRSNN